MINKALVNILLYQCDSPLQVVHFFFCPQLHQLSGALLLVTTFESVVLSDVSISVLELIECSFEYLHSYLIGDTTILWSGRGQWQL